MSPTMGKMEVEYYQLTPIGAARMQSGQLPRLDPSSKQVLEELVALGGTAELDELKHFGEPHNPMTLRTGLRRLVDMGYVTPVTFPEGGAQ